MGGQSESLALIRLSLLPAARGWLALEGSVLPVDEARLASEEMVTTLDRDMRPSEHALLGSDGRLRASDAALLASDSRLLPLDIPLLPADIPLRPSDISLLASDIALLGTEIHFLPLDGGLLASDLALRSWALRRISCAAGRWPAARRGRRRALPVVAMKVRRRCSLRARRAGARGGRAGHARFPDGALRQFAAACGITPARIQERTNLPNPLP